MQETTTSEKKKARRVEIIATALLGLATVGSAWSAYWSGWWGSLQAVAFARGAALNVEASRATNRAAMQVQIDVSLFISWMVARASDQTGVEAYLSDRFRPEFKPAFKAWLALPKERLSGTNVQTPPGSPFDLPQYRLAAQERAERLQAEAAAVLAKGEHASEISTKYLEPIVLFAIALFFAGLSTKGLGIRRTFLLIGSVLALVAGIVRAVLLTQGI